MSDPELKLASSEDTVIHACPLCGHKSAFFAQRILRGLSYVCDACGRAIQFHSNSTRPSYDATLTITGREESITVNAAIRTDGVWFFIAPDEAEILPTLDHDSDRAVAVIVGAMIENRLERALRARMPHNDSKTLERIFRPSGPLGTFSSKIDLAFLSGLLSKVAFEDMKNFKEIRNSFAHKLNIKNFNSQAIKDRASRLQLIDDYVAEADFGPDTLTRINMAHEAKPAIYVLHASMRKKNARDRYLMTAQIFTIRLAPLELRNYDLPFV